MEQGTERMTISISPNYEMFLTMLLIWWIIRGSVLIVAGLTHLDKDKSAKHGSFDVVAGFVLLLLSAWVMM